QIEVTNTRAPASVAPRIARFIVVSSLDQFWRRHISAQPARRPCCVARVSRHAPAMDGPHETIAIQKAAASLWSRGNDLARPTWLRRSRQTAAEPSWRSHIVGLRESQAPITVN